MKSGQYFICLAVSGLCLLMTVLLFLVGQSASGLQTTLAQQQEEINKGSMSQQVGASLLRDMIQVAVNNNNARLLDLLRKNGITFTPQAAPAAAAPAPAPTPAPAPEPKKK